MNEKALQSLYDEMSAQYDVGSFEDFKEYLSDDKQRNAFFEEAIKPNYDVASLDEFDNTYGLKKKEDFISEDPKSESELDKDFSGIPIFKFISDAVGRGVAQGNTTDEALGLLMSGNSATEEEINEYVKAVQAMESYAPSESMNKFQKEYIENGSDVSAFLSALWNNKSVAPEILLQSFAGMATAATTDEGAALATAGLTAGAGAGAFIGGVGAIPGGFIGGMAAANGALETATSLTEFIKDELDERGSKFNSENVRAILQDEDAFSSIKTKALLRGGIISSIDLIGGGVAGKAVKGVSEVSKIGARATKLAQVGTGLAIESTAGGLGEAAAMAATGQEMDAAEIGLEAIGGTVTAPISIGGAMRQSTYKLKKGNESVEYTREQLQKEVEKDPSILAEAELEIKNAPEGEKEKYDAIQKRERIKKDLPSDIPSENVEQIIDKEIEADELKNKKSIAAKKRSKEIISEIEQLMKAEEKKEDVAESVAEEEPFETKRVKITEPFTIGQSEVLFNEDGSVSDVVNKRTGNPVTPSTRSKVEKKILQDVIDVDAGKKAPEQEGLTPDNIASYVAENSENVREIAETIKTEKQRIKDAEQRAGQIKTQDRGKESLAGETFTRESWESATGTPPSDNISNYWIRSEEKGGKDIKDGAKGFDADTVVEFILDYPNAEALKVLTGEPLDRNDLIDLENKFEQLTGIKPTESNLQTVVGIEEGRTPVEVLKIQEQEQLQRQAQEPGVFGKKKGPSAQKITNQPLTEETTVNVYQALKDQIKLEARAAREKKYSMDEARRNLAENISELLKKGNISAKQALSLVRKVSSVNLDNPVLTERVISYAQKIFDNADNQNKISKAESLKKSIKNQLKKKTTEATVKGAVKDFLKIDVNLVENIDEYLSVLSNINEGLKSTRVVKGEVKLSKEVNLRILSEYISKELPKQTEIREQAFIEKYQEILGEEAEGLSYQQLKDAVDAIPKEEDTQERKSKEKDLIKATFESLSDAVKEAMDFGTGAPEVSDVFDVTDMQKALIKRFSEIDLDLLTTKESILALDAMKNFLVNGTTGGMKKILSEFEGRSAARKLLGDGFAGYKIKSIGRFWGKQLATLNILSEYIFRGQKKGLQFFQDSGIQGIINGNAKSLKDHETLQNEYDDTFAKRKANNEDFGSSYNIVERGMVSFAIRNLQGTIPQQVDEFVRRKKLIEQSIESLRRQGGDLAKKADFYQQAYEKVLEDSVNAEEVLSKADPVNREAVDWWIDKWSNIYPDLYDVSLNIYNKLLSKDVRYTPDFYARVRQKESDTDLFAPSFEDNLNNVIYDKESRTLKETVRPRTLDAQAASYVELNFDRANMNAYKGALVDVNTAESISKANGFLNDPAFSSLIQDDETRTVLKDRIYAYVRNIKGGNRPTSQDNRKLSEILDKVATFSVGRALGGPTQYIKQLVPIVNTLVNAGDLSISAFNKPGAMQFILNSGYSIASRGFASLSEIKSLNDSVKDIKLGSLDNKALNSFLNGAEGLNRKFLKVFVQNPDRYAAQLSWLTYYIKDLKSQGFSQDAIDNIDWETHKINTQSADYAQQQVDRQQNVSDAGLQGEFFSSRGVGISLARKIILPFMNFAMNQKSRMYSDVFQLTSRHATPEDKSRAKASLAGLAAETAAFNTLGVGISMGLYAATKGIMGGDEETPEEQQKRVMNIIRGRTGNIVSDIFSPLPKLTDPKIIDGINFLLRTVQEGDEKDMFQLFSRDKDTFYDQLGLFGIGPKYAGELFELSKIAMFGEYTDNYGRVIKLEPKAQELAVQVFLPKLLYASGYVPVEVGTMSNYATKELKKLKKSKQKSSGSTYQRTYKY